MKKYLLFILIISGLVLPIFVRASILSGPIVPCGGQGQNPCTLCDIFVMAKNIIDFLLLIIFFVATIFIVIGGIRMLTSAGSPEHVDRGKRMITAAIVGVIIALLSWILLAELFIALVGKTTAEGGDVGQGFPWPWNEIQCVGGGVVEPPETSVFCCCDLSDGSYTCSTYSGMTECQSDCSTHCQGFSGYIRSCCVYAKGSCGGAPGSRCDKMSAAGYCFNNEYWCVVGVKDQIVNVSVDLISLLNCMKNTLPKDASRNISSITDNSGGRCITAWAAPQCSGSTDSCTGTCCAHIQNSLHYGGTGCRGYSYAVDFADEASYNIIKSAALGCFPSGLQVINEGNHVHIELQGEAQKDGCL